MEMREYDKMLSTIEELIVDYKNETEKVGWHDSNFDIQDVRYALFGIPPVHRFLSINKYRKAPDKEVYKKKCIDNLQRFVYRYGHGSDKSKVTYLAVLSSALMKDEVYFENILLDTPKEISDDFLENFHEYLRSSQYISKKRE